LKQRDLLIDRCVYVKPPDEVEQAILDQLDEFERELWALWAKTLSRQLQRNRGRVAALLAQRAERCGGGKKEPGSDDSGEPES